MKIYDTIGYILKLLYNNKYHTYSYTKPYVPVKKIRSTSNTYYMMSKFYETTALNKCKQ